MYEDLVFVLGGERIPLHRAVLAARSPFFHKMLRTAWLPPQVSGTPCFMRSVLSLLRTHPATAGVKLAFPVPQGGGVRRVHLRPDLLRPEALRALVIYMYRFAQLTTMIHATSFHLPQEVNKRRHFRARFTHACFAPCSERLDIPMEEAPHMEKVAHKVKCKDLEQAIKNELYTMR